MTGCNFLRQSSVQISVAVILVMGTVVHGKDAPAAAATSWTVWIPPTPFAYDGDALRQKFSQLNEDQRISAGLHLIQKWGRDARKEVFEVAESCELPLDDCFERWARSDFEAALERAEQWDGFGGNLLRRGVFAAVAKSDPVEAARRMRSRLDPMSRQYYYYVTTQALTPALADQPSRIILQALREMRSDLFFMDEFRWGDATATLINLREPWNPADPAREWAYLTAQPPSMERDFMLCVTLEVWLKKDLEKAIALDVPPLYGDMLKYRLESAFPLDLEKVPDLLPVANFQLIRSWVQQMKWRKLAPDWRQWAAMSALNGDAPAKRHALDTVMRLWVEKDEMAAIEWTQQLPPGPARETAQAACLEAEIGHLLVDDWHRALSLAKAMPPGERKDRCLNAVFAGAANEEFHVLQPHLEALSVPDAQQARIRDAWRKARSLFLQLRGEHLRGLSLMLDLEDPLARKRETMDLLGSVTREDGDQVNAVLEKSSLSREDKDAFQLQMVLLAVDGGPRVQGYSDRLKASMRILDPETRFVHQRAVIHEVAEDDLAKARTLIEESPLSEEDKRRLGKDWERISKWERRENKQTAK